MLNTHIEHPEDTILTGNLDFLKAVKSYTVAPHGHVSVKIDGSPAIIWGTHPVTQKFFVGTKSVFNRKLIKVNYTHKDIDKNHISNSISEAENELSKDEIDDQKRFILNHKVEVLKSISTN